MRLLLPRADHRGGLPHGVDLPVLPHLLRDAGESPFRLPDLLPHLQARRGDHPRLLGLHLRHLRVEPPRRFLRLPAPPRKLRRLGTHRSRSRSRRSITSGRFGPGPERYSFARSRTSSGNRGTARSRSPSNGRGPPATAGTSAGGAPVERHRNVFESGIREGDPSSSSKCVVAATRTSRSANVSRKARAIAALRADPFTRRPDRAAPANRGPRREVLVQPPDVGGVGGQVPSTLCSVSHRDEQVAENRHGRIRGGGDRRPAIAISGSSPAFQRHGLPPRWAGEDQARYGGQAQVVRDHRASRSTRYSGWRATRRFVSRRRSPWARRRRSSSPAASAPGSRRSGRGGRGQGAVHRPFGRPGRELRRGSAPPPVPPRARPSSPRCSGGRGPPLEEDRLAALGRVVDDPLEGALRARLEGDHHAARPDRCVRSWTWRASAGRRGSPPPSPAGGSASSGAAAATAPVSPTLGPVRSRRCRSRAPPPRRGRAAAGYRRVVGHPRVPSAPVLEEPADPLPDACRLSDPQQFLGEREAPLAAFPTSSRISFTSSSGRAPSCRSIRRPSRFSSSDARMASRSVPGESAAHRPRPGSEEAWGDSRAVIFPHRGPTTPLPRAMRTTSVALLSAGHPRLHYNRIVVA